MITICGEDEEEKEKQEKKVKLIFRIKEVD